MQAEALEDLPDSLGERVPQHLSLNPPKRLHLDWKHFLEALPPQQQNPSQLHSYKHKQQPPQQIPLQAFSAVLPLLQPQALVARTSLPSFRSYLVAPSSNSTPTSILLPVKSSNLESTNSTHKDQPHPYLSYHNRCPLITC